MTTASYNSAIKCDLPDECERHLWCAGKDVTVMKYDLSNTEREIMEVLWARGVDHAGMAPKEIIKIFSERGRNWKRQTLNTYFARLEEKGLIRRECGIVEAGCSKREYESLYCHEILEQNYGGKLSAFLCAFSGMEGISEEEAAELLKMIQRRVRT